MSEYNSKISSLELELSQSNEKIVALQDENSKLLQRIDQDRSLNESLSQLEKALEEREGLLLLKATEVIRS
jgi:septal ring factor EnvC (AmiA/AmiB activator)